MGWPVIFTDQSLNDLHGIVVYIARNDQQAARRFGNALIDQALSIGKFPEMGRIVPEFSVPGLREMVHGAYRIIYEISYDPNTVYVVRFWHAARGIPEIRTG